VATVNHSNAKMAVTSRSYRGALFAAMRSALADHDHTVIIGQGVTDHKGIFGTTTGLADAFGRDRVIETPLAEEAITGVCIGAALNGLYPINTHIRADFSLLAFNQLINLAAKYKYMFGGLFEVPMLVRLVIGRSWGQGAQHSQSLQSLFAHIPGLTVIMPSTPECILASYDWAIRRHRGPVISLEHRLMYDLAFAEGGWSAGAGATPFSSRLLREGKDVTIVATSIMVLEAMRAADYLAGHGIDCEVIDLHCVSHPDKAMILKSLAHTGRLLVADTSWPMYGVSAEICRFVAETDPRLLTAPVVTLGMQPAPCPTAKSLEDLYYPDLAHFVEAVARLVRGRVGIPLPDARSMTDFYKSFKGPF
jgi:pyruvate/2-oxoglutarate/acetoin dehydrogenase E1 component